MATRIPASMRTREALSALIEGRLASPAGRSELVELATRLIVEEALEGEVRDALDRGYYEHGRAPGQGHRNGHRTQRLKTAEGALEYAAPQVAGLAHPFRSALRDHLKGHTEALESLAVEMLARGLSVRDLERTPSRTRPAGCCSRRPRSPRSASSSGRTIRVSSPAIWRSTTSRICSSTGSPSGSAPGSGASRSWPRGASPSTAARCCST